jgi:thiamine-phosphate pyrophosphorylase
MTCQVTSSMIRCAITDRHLRGIERADADWVQVRDKNLCARELLRVVRRAMSLAPRAKILVNTRMDVALAAGTAGLHLPAGSIPAARWRSIAPANFLIGVSCHTTDEVRAAENEGADYVFFGPVFAPNSKTSDLAPRGIDGLAGAARAVKIPVLALGGITRENTAACLTAGAAGIAGISIFETC